MTKQVGIKGIVRLVHTGTGGGISPSGRPWKWQTGSASYRWRYITL